MVKKDSVVSLCYCLKNANGEELDRADKDKPFAYLHGNGQMVPGLEKEWIELIKISRLLICMVTGKWSRDWKKNWKNW